MKKIKVLAITISSFCALIVAVGLLSMTSHTTIHTASGKSDSKPNAPKQNKIFLANLMPRGESVPESVTPVPEQSPTPDPVPQTAINDPKPKASPKPIQKAPTVKAATSNIEAATPISCGGSFTQQLICLLNQYRASKGKGKVSTNSGLAGVALTHSTWMNSTGTFSHTGAGGSRLGDRCAAANITCRAENLAEGVSSAQQLLDLWIASPSHNVNLLGPYSTAGLGISGTYITLLLN